MYPNKETTMAPAVEVTRLGAHLASVERRLDDVNAKVDALSAKIDALSLQLQHIVRLEERLTFLTRGLDLVQDDVRDHEERLSDVEHSMPQLKETRRWIIGTCATVMAGAGAFIWKLLTAGKLLS